MNEEIIGTDCSSGGMDTQSIVGTVELLEFTKRR